MRLKKIPASPSRRARPPRPLVKISMRAVHESSLLPVRVACPTRRRASPSIWHATCSRPWLDAIRSRPLRKVVNSWRAVALPPLSAGTHSSHGHFGLSVGRFRFLSVVVQRLPGGRSSHRSPFSSGPGLLAALTTRDVGFVRMPAPAGRTASATRRRSPVVNRAVPIPAHSVGTSGGWMGRTRTGQRTRLRRP